MTPQEVEMRFRSMSPGARQALLAGITPEFGQALAALLPELEPIIARAINAQPGQVAGGENPMAAALMMQ